MSTPEIPSWLVRSAKNSITGPYSRDQVVRLVLDRKIGLEDEVGLSQGYWILLSEREEVMKQLGIEVPHPKNDEEDTTETAARNPQRTREILEKSEQSSSSGTTVAKLHIQPLPTLKPVEGASLWRGMIWVLIGVAVIAVLRVLQLLGSR